MEKQKSITAEIQRACVEWYERNPGERGEPQDIHALVDPEAFSAVSQYEHEVAIVKAHLRKAEGSKVPVKDPMTGELVLVPCHAIIKYTQDGRQIVVPKEFATDPERQRFIDVLLINENRARLRRLAEQEDYRQMRFPGMEREAT